MNLIYDFSNISPIDYAKNGDIDKYLADSSVMNRSKYVDVYKRTEPSRIYLARPNKRILGALNGIDEQSCNLTIDFINADEITFDVYRYLGATEKHFKNTWYEYQEESSWYQYIDILMEIYVDGFGWFFIDESPTVHNDGLKEHKTVVAKSYEYTLHQYDLETFDINTANRGSREMLADDNVYTYYSSSEVHYNIFRDRVLFYRDTSEHEALLNELTHNTSYTRFQELLVNYPHFVQTAWRIDFDLTNITDAFTQMKNNSDSEAERTHWQDMIDNASTVTTKMIKDDLILYPDLITYLTLVIDKKKRIYNSEDDVYEESEDDLELTPYQLTELEYKRIKKLSLLDLCLSDVPDVWTIGYVDTSIPTNDDGIPLYVDGNGLPLLLKDETGSFEIDSQDVYTFMVNELAGYFNCIFQFDTINNIINVYRIESIGVDTRIFLSFRNVENEVNITPSQELFTQFTVENSEGMGITNVNFGQREIEDISYFLKPEYLPQYLIDKYKRYLFDRESKRDAYVDLSRRYNKQLEKCNEIKTRVPSDMLNISQLNKFKSKEQIEETVANYYALLVGMLKAFIFQDISEIEVPDFYSPDIYDSFDEYIEAWDAYLDELYRHIDKENPADPSAVTFEHSLYYDSYCAIREFTIPNLVVAYENLDLPSYEKKELYDDAFECIFDNQHPDCVDNITYGDWYGINELKAYQKMHLDEMQALENFITDWDDIEAAAQNDNEDAQEFIEKHSEAEYTIKHDLYIKHKNAYESATRELETRQNEYNEQKVILDRLYDERKLLADAMLIRNWSEDVGYTIYNQEDDIYLYDDGTDEEGQHLDDVFLMLEHNVSAFTDAEVDLISRFYRHTDYTNDNINHLSNIDTSDTDIDKELEMLKAAQNELYAESHPQYSYTTTVDNLLANNEYKGYHPEFNVGNFVRLGLDDETQVNLRMIKLTFNPMTMNNNLEIQFSNMINYRGERNDFANLLDSVITSAKNTISARYERSADSDNTIQVTYDLVQKILESAPFANYTSANQTNAVSAATGVFSTLSSEYTKTKYLDAEMANIVKLQADSIFANYLKTELIVSKALKADEATIANLATEALTAQSIDADNITTDNLSADSAIFKYLEANLVVASEIRVDDLKAKLAQIDTLSANSAFVHFLETDITTAKSLTADTADIATLATEAVTAQSIDASNINVDNLFGESALFEYLESNLIVAAEIQVDDLKAKLAQVDTLDANSAFVSFLETDITVANALSADTADIATLATESMTARSIDANNIDVSNLTAQSAIVDYMQSNLIFATEITVDDLKAKLAQVDTLTAGSAFVTYLQGLSSTVAQSTITDAYIYNAVAGKITVADLAAGDIVLGNQMRILTNSGATEGMVMSGSELQFLDDQGNPSISIGYNTVSDGQGGTTVDYSTPSIVIKDSNGSVMLNSSGLSQGDVGLASMIQTSSISKNQLNFPIVDTDENGNISITNIKDGTGGNFGVEYTNFKQNTNDAIDALDDKIDDSLLYDIQIVSSNGNIFKNGEISTILSAVVYRANEDITSTLNASLFHWIKKDKDGNLDTAWNTAHFGGTKQVTITASDIYARATFEVTVDGIPS